jgi:hypothetical protein
MADDDRPPVGIAREPTAFGHERREHASAVF